MKDTEQMPTQDEIVSRINARKNFDVLGFELGEYIPYLDFGHAKPFLKPDATKKTWDKARLNHNRDDIIARMKDYMPFAWEKARYERGISANRSIMHFIAWAWLAGDREFADEIDREFHTNYSNYGVRILRRICDFYGWEIPE